MSALVPDCGRTTVTHENRVEGKMGRFVRAIKAVAVAGAAFLGGMLVSERNASAQEIQLTGPLKGAPAVRHLRLYREGRIEFAPSVTFTLLDEYRRTMFVGA